MNKTHKATHKRLMITKNGKVRRHKQSVKNNSHLKNKRKSTRKIVQDRLRINSKKQVKKVKMLINR